MGFGEVGKEPIDNVHFYSKNEPNRAFKMQKYQVLKLTYLKYLSSRIFINIMTVNLLSIRFYQIAFLNWVITKRNELVVCLMNKAIWAQALSDCSSLWCVPEFIPGWVEAFVFLGLRKIVFGFCCVPAGVQSQAKEVSWISCEGLLRSTESGGSKESGASEAEVLSWLVQRQ